MKSSLKRGAKTIYVVNADGRHELIDVSSLFSLLPAVETCLEFEEDDVNEWEKQSTDQTEIDESIPYYRAALKGAWAFVAQFKRLFEEGEEGENEE